MSPFLYLFLPFLSVASATNAGLFDIAEYRRIAYDATIGDDFLWFAPGLDIKKVSASNIDEFEQRILSEIPKETESNYVFVTSKGGQKFACALPNVEDLKILTEASVPRSSKNPKIYGDALAASFYIDKCIRLRGNNWWAYTLCRGQTVEQTHGEEGHDGYAKNILGLFDGNLKMPPFHESTDDRLLYVEESYTSGTFCDLPEFREPRRTSVRYHCDAQLSTNEAYIQSLVEVRPCEYLMTVKVGSLCHFPEFLPVAQANTQKVGCQPYMSKQDVRSLLEKAIEERNKQENFKKEGAVVKHDYRVAADRLTAMTKSQRKLFLPDKIKRVNAEMNYRAAHFNLMVYNSKLSGEATTKKKEESMWKVIETADITDYFLYVDYETIEDENRGHLWYYFHEPTWPKNQFPKDIYSTLVQNAYLDELQEILEYSEFQFDEEKGGYIIELGKYFTTGVLNQKFNLVISAMQIYNDIVDHKMQQLSKKHLTWLYYIYGEHMFNEDGSIDKLISFFSSPIGDLLPFNNHSVTAISDLFAETDRDIRYFMKRGDQLNEMIKNSSPKRRVLYDTLTATPAPPEMKARGFDYQISIANKTATLKHMERIYEVHLAIVYQLLSIQYFQEVFGPTYFHIHPSFDDDGWGADKDYRKFHMNMFADMLKFKRMLAAGTVHKIELMIMAQNGQKDIDSSADTFIRKWLKTEKALTEKPDYDSYKEFKNTFYNSLVRHGPKAIDQARERLWDKKVEKWRTDYWKKDYKLRKEAQSIHSLMSDLLSMRDGADIISTIGKASKTIKEKMTDEELFSKVRAILDLSEEELDVTELIDVEKEKLSETLKASLLDEEMLEWDDMKDVFDLLGKAGLSENADVQIKLIDANGNELNDDQVEAMTKTLLGEFDSINRFRDLEKAYAAKPSWNDGEVKEEDDEEK